MYARNVSISLRPNSTSEFTTTLKRQILPMLRSQTGFKDEITFVGANGTDVLAISLWDHKESADVYGRDTYPQVLAGLEKVIEGTPEVQSFQVANSIFHKGAAPR